MKTSNKCISTLELQVASKDAQNASNEMQADCLEKCVGTAEEGTLKVLANIREHGLQLCAAHFAHASAESVHRSGRSPLYVFCASESSLQEEVSRIQ